MISHSNIKRKTKHTTAMPEQLHYCKWSSICCSNCCISLSQLIIAKNIHSSPLIWLLKCYYCVAVSHNPSMNVLHLSFGRGCPDKKEWISERASLGLFSGTKCPAPRTVTIVRPSYSTILPPTCNFNDHQTNSRGQVV